MSFWKVITRKEDPRVYDNKDGHLVQSSKARDSLVLGVGTIMSASIFALPGEVAVTHTGSSMIISFLIAAIVAGLVVFAYVETAAAMPFAGSAYPWINVMFGEFSGWVAGWALLTEYPIALAFVGSDLSVNSRALFVPLGRKLPASLSNAFGTEGGAVDIVSVIVIILVALLISHGVSQAARVESLPVILKVFVILLFIVVGLTAIRASNFMLFIPQYRETANGAFGGWQGARAGVSMISLSYIRFDLVAANSAETINPQKTIPRGILGSLVIAVVFFIVVSPVLIGVLPYQQYANSAKPVGLALRAAHHSGAVAVVQTIAVLGILTASTGMSMAGLRSTYSSGRDGMLPKWLGKLDKHNRLNRAFWTLIIGAALIGAFSPFAFLSQLISVGMLIVFMLVSSGTYALRRREGKDIPNPSSKMPLYPVLSTPGFLAPLLVFMGSDYQVKLYAGIWFVFGLIIYFAYGMRHSSMAKKGDGQNVENETEAGGSK